MGGRAAGAGSDVFLRAQSNFPRLKARERERRVSRVSPDVSLPLLSLLSCFLSLSLSHRGKKQWTMPDGQPTTTTVGRPDRRRIYRVQFSTLARSLVHVDTRRGRVCLYARSYVLARHYGCVRAAWVTSHAPGPTAPFEYLSVCRETRESRLRRRRRRRRSPAPEKAIRASKTGRVRRRYPISLLNAAEKVPLALSLSLSRSVSGVVHHRVGDRPLWATKCASALGYDGQTLHISPMIMGKAIDTVARA